MNSYSVFASPFFSQGDPADSVFYLQKGRAKVTVVSSVGKEAVIALLSAGDFVGEEALAAIAGSRLATATAITACTTLKISREEMIRVMHLDHSFSDLFLKVILERSMRIQADLVDHLFNSNEKRLARILLLMAEFSNPGDPDQYVPKISQQTLAEMIGTPCILRMSCLLWHSAYNTCNSCTRCRECYRYRLHTLLGTVQRQVRSRRGTRRSEVGRQPLLTLGHKQRLFMVYAQIDNQ